MRILLILIFSLAWQVHAQKLSFNGLGRVAVHLDRTAENHTDSLIKDNTMGGYSLVDLGLDFKPFSYFKGNAVVRLKNPFGMFWGDGVQLSIRQFRFEGIANKVIRYQIGDIDLRMSNYTLFNPYPFPENLPEFMLLHKEIQEYENFVTKNSRRMQGITLFSVLESPDEISQLRMRLMLARNQPDLFSGETEQIFFGGNGRYVYRNVLNLTYNQTGFYSKNVSSQIPESRNRVSSLEFKIQNQDSVNLPLKLEGEIGFSSNMLAREGKDSLRKSGKFLDVGIALNIKSLICLKLGIISVNPRFFSVGAQTVRYPYSVWNNTSGLGTGENLFALLWREDIYDRSLNFQLAATDPRYNNIFPYGPATPNRQGLSFAINSGFRKNLDMAFKTFAGKEILGEGTPELRHFYRAEGNVKVRLNNFPANHRTTLFNFNIRTENTSRKAFRDTASVRLQNLFLGIGADLETLRNLYISGGILANISKGNEYQTLRDYGNTIVNFQHIDINSREAIYSLGLIWKFANNSFFTVKWFNSFYSESGNREQRLRQFYFNYTASF